MSQMNLPLKKGAFMKWLNVFFSYWTAKIRDGKARQMIKAVHFFPKYFQNGTKLSMWVSKKDIMFRPIQTSDVGNLTTNCHSQHKQMQTICVFPIWFPYNLISFAFFLTVSYHLEDLEDFLPSCHCWSLRTKIACCALVMELLHRFMR